MNNFFWSIESVPGSTYVQSPPRRLIVLIHGLLNGVVGGKIIGRAIVTTAWRVLRLRMEETPSSYGGKLRIY
jgi:hypothetical protein